MASSTGIRAGAAYVELFLKNNLSKGLANAEKSVRAFAVRLTDVGKKMLGVSAAVAAPLAAAAKVFADTGDAFEKMSQRTGVSVEALQELAFAAKQSGTDTENLEGGIRRMQKTLIDAASGSTSAQESLATLGLSVKDLLGLAPDEQFKRIADGLARISDPTLKAAAAMDVFGKTGTTLLPLMADGGKGIEALQAEFRALGITMSREDASAAAAMGDALDKAFMTAKGGAAIIGRALAPAITRVSGIFTKVMADAAQWIKHNQGLITSIAAVTAGVGAAGVAMVATGAAVGVAAKALGVLAIAVKGVGVAVGLLTTPLGLVTAGIVAVGVVSGVAGKAVNWLGARFGELGQFAGATFKGITDAMAAGDMGLAARVMWAGVKVAYQAGVNELQKIWQGFRVWAVDVGIGIYQGIMGTCNDLWHGMRVAWIEGTAALKTIWATFAEWHAKAVESLTDELTRQGPARTGAKYGGGLVGAGIAKLTEKKQDPETERYLAKQHNDRLQQIRDETDAQLAAINEQRNARRNAEGDRYGAREAEIGGMSGGAISEAMKTAADALAKSQEDLAAAQAELKDVLAKASQARAFGGAAGPAGMPAMPDLGEVMLGAAKHTIGVAGTFNAAETRGLGAGSVADRIANATEKTAENTRKLIDKLRGQAVFE